MYTSTYGALYTCICYPVRASARQLFMTGLQGIINHPSRHPGPSSRSAASYSIYKCTTHTALVSPSGPECIILPRPSQLPVEASENILIFPACPTSSTPFPRIFQPFPVFLHDVIYVQILCLLRRATLRSPGGSLLLPPCTTHPVNGRSLVYLQCLWPIARYIQCIPMLTLLLYMTS